MCQNFTYDVVGQRRRLKAIKKKIVPQKLNVILFFDIEFFKYFFRILHETSNWWLKLCLVYSGTLNVSGIFFKFHLIVGAEQSIVNAPLV
jgi:hypothetical protein